MTSPTGKTPSRLTTRSFAKLDGTGRVPRKVQLDLLQWLADGWNDADVHAVQMPVGGGKSLISRTLQLAMGAHVITPSNVLIDQYIETYPAVNFLKGKAHYRCKTGMSCSDWIEASGESACSDCPYTSSKRRAQSEPTFFNPLSLYYYLINAPAHVPVMVVDEAHQLGSLLMTLCQRRFARSRYKWHDRLVSEVHLVPWMKTLITRLQSLANTYANTKNLTKHELIYSEISSLGLTIAGLEDDPQNYAIYTEHGHHNGRPEQYLVVRPIRPPISLVRRMLRCDKLVLLSGTLLPTDIEDLSGDLTTRFIDLPSPIPPDRRPILYRPVPFPMNHETDPALIAAAIERVLDGYPRQNTIIHVSYALGKKIASHFTRPLLKNTSENKAWTLETFKRDGGTWLASGCAEGLDLRDDLCRLNVIPRLSYPDLKDPVVQKRKALQGGQRWYDLETLKIAVQQAGRSTRHETDASVTVVMDPQFSRLVNRHRAALPQSFVEAIRWSGRF